MPYHNILYPYHILKVFYTTCKHNNCHKFVRFSHSNVSHGNKPLLPILETRDRWYNLRDVIPVYLQFKRCSVSFDSLLFITCGSLLDRFVGNGMCENDIRAYRQPRRPSNL